MPKKPGDYQPTKYDWIALEAEFITGDQPVVSKFMKDKAIPRRTYEKQTIGWGEKRDAVKRKGLKLIENKKAQEIAKASEYRHKAGATLMNLGFNHLIPDEKDPKSKPLVPTTAGEAAKMVIAGAAMQRAEKDSMMEAVRIEFQTMAGPAASPSTETVNLPATGPLVSVSIRMPSNGRELPANG